MTEPTHTPSERGFWHLVAVQFQGAFSDNILKQLIILGLVAVLYNTESEQSKWNGVVGGIFVLPGFLASIWAGQLADKYSKRSLTIITKVVEIFIMGLATFVMATMPDPHQMFVWSLAVLFLLANQFTFFSPNKYGIIPELVSPRRLSWANGVIELTTFVAIIMGTGIVPFLLNYIKASHHYWMIGVALMGMAAAGLIASFGIDRTPPANPQRRFEVNFVPQFFRYCKMIKASRTLLLTNIGLCYFWFLGILVLNHVNVWGEHSLGLATADAGWLYVVLSLGIGLGAMIAGWLSHGKIELGLIPMGGIGMAVFSLPLAFARPDILWLVRMEYFFLFMVGVSAGFFSLPLNALLQRESNAEDRGGMIAANNLFNSGAMVVSSVFLIALNAIFHPPANAVFLIASILSLIATIVIVRLLPESLLRFVAFLFTSFVYRLRVFNTDRIPATGGVLFVSNHVSFIDALLIGTASPRPVRFIAHEEFFQNRIIGYFLRATGSIPVGSAQRPREMLKSLKVAGEALAAGEIVCLFPEGQLTRIGQMLPFHRGYELILRHHAAPIVPVYLDGLWGSIFSFEGRRFFWKFPRRVPYPVRVNFGLPLPSDSEPFAIRQAVEAAGAETAIKASPDRRPLHHEMIHAARRNWRRFAMVDAATPALSWGHALTGSILFARKLAPLWGDQKNVGIMLPPSIGASLVNYAATLSGRMAVNLNYTVGQEVLKHCADQARLQTVITSRKFLEKVNLQPPVEAIYIEDYREAPPPAAKLAALVVARLFPIRALERYCKAVAKTTIDSPATIIFSSGSTGTPKGVLLTHFNVISNIESFRQAFRFETDDRLLAALPFFHSFGFTVSLWGSAALPFGQILHLNPLDSKTIGELCLEHNVTLLITTPTFMQQYSRRIPAEHFGGLNIVVAGAERLPENVADAFRERFGIEPLEGYGTTECSPVVAVNVPDFRAPGFVQIGNKRGSVGHPIPGVAVRVVDPETRKILGADTPGLLEVHGANVMGGYLDLPEKTAEVLWDGWYNTGDMAKIDEDGFIFITGRLSRFSKIGGEMVPHGAVEDKLHQLVGAEEQQLAVTAVPDEKKGEQLVVLHTLDPSKIDDLLKKLPGSGLPNIFIPKKEMFFKVEAIPMLGSGKLDLKKVNELAKELAGKTG